MKILKLLIASCILCIFALSCTNQKSTTMIKNKTKDVSTGDGKFIISGPIVLKKFVDAKGKITDRQDYYIQRSIQDYYIKFCESVVSRAELETYLATKNEILKTATLEIEYRDGDWDNCNGDGVKVQSRTGAYIIVHKIIGE